ncbi:MAG: T9SS C-terminal target domain-containing protein [Bacteroidetes bacterium]|nr:MAG: T9SS C-terminal target domain-containing protein [Bacteroidota bacterium]
MKRSLRNYALLLCLLLFAGMSAHAQCEIDSTVANLPPGLYPNVLSDAQGCEFYEEVITFRLPRDTMVSFGGAILTLPFLSFTIIDVEGLPPGMDWICNLDSLDCFYEVNPDNPDPDTLGCVRIFGTPEVPGFYPLGVTVLARLRVAGEQTVPFEISLNVQPCVFTSDCYTFAVSEVCTPATLTLSNNVPSMGVEGFSYKWEISGPDNFLFISEEEDPTIPPLESGGEYIIRYDATVDTVGTVLTQAIIESVNCNDLLDAGDIYWLLKDSSGTEYFSTAGQELSNAGNDTPIVTNIPETVLPPGVYEFQVWDNDDFFLDPDDDGCADGRDNGEAGVVFTIPLPDSLLAGDTLKLTNQGLSVSLMFNRPVTNFSCSDTFHIYARPEVPQIEMDGDTVLCEGESVLLSTGVVADSLQWFFDGQALETAHSSSLEVSAPGLYSVEAINLGGLCSAASANIEIEQVLVDPPMIDFDSNRTVFVLNAQPDLSYEWFDHAGPIGTGDSLELSTSSAVRAQAIDVASGCRSALSDSLVAILAGRFDEATLIQSWTVYPNPSQGNFRLRAELHRPQSVKLHIKDLFGRTVYSKSYHRPVQQIDEQISLPHLARGMYLITLEFEAGTASRKVLLH